MKYLYIVSSPHGGSTLLSMVLGRHPQATNLGELSFLPKELALGELCTCGEPISACAEWGRLFDALADRHGTDLRANPYGLQLGDAIKDRHGAGSVDTAHQTPRLKMAAKCRGVLDTAALLGAPHRTLMALLTPPSVKHSIRNTLAVYETAARLRGCELVIDASKLPRKAPRLFQADPEHVRILHMVRDGRGVLASRSYMSARRAARRWNHYHRLTRRLLRRWVVPEAQKQLRYEDFVAHPALHLEELCQWLGLEYSAAMLDLAEGAADHSAGGNPARFRLGGGIRPADDKWRLSLGPEQLQVFERAAGALNRQFGYH